MKFEEMEFFKGLSNLTQAQILMIIQAIEEMKWKNYLVVKQMLTDTNERGFGIE